jgi:hypothetical protein
MRALSTTSFGKPSQRTTLAARLSLIVFAALFLAVFIEPRASMQEGSAPVQVAERATDKLSRVATKEDSKAGESDEVTAESQAPSGLSPELITGVTYPFTSASGVVLEDMSSGTTQLVGAGQDDTASAVTNIGFDFWYDGVRATQFSVNANGLIRLGGTVVSTGFSNSLSSTTDAPKIGAYWDDLCTGTNGKVHFKVVGSAPNRKLVVEWNNMQITRGAGCAGVGTGTFQSWLFESAAAANPGVIEFVYGALPIPNVGADGGYSVGLQSGVATNFASVTTSSNTVSYAAAENANATAITAGTAYLFTPNVPLAPSGMGVDMITQTSMRLNWGDNATNEVGYVIYRSTDNVNFSFLTQIAANSTSFTDTLLSPGTTYFYQINAVSEGALSTNLALAGTTSPAGNLTSVQSGNWSDSATWGGSVPSSADNVTIANGHTVTIDSSSALTVTVQSGGVLQFEATTARTLTVTQSVTINSGGTFQSNAAGTQTGHILSVGTDLINNGTIDFSTNANTAAAGIVFTGAADASFTLGAASTTDLKQSVSGAGVTLNKGTNNTPILTFTPGGTLTVLGANAVGFLSITNGTFKLGGTNTFSNPLFNVAAFAIPATGGFWMNNTNATVVAQNGTGTVTGSFRMTLGTFNLGTGAGSALAFASGANINVEGGAINSSGRFAVTAAANAITYNQTGGTITVCTVGNTSTTLASFDLGTGVGTTNISGGTIVVQLASTAASGPRDYRNQSGLTGTTTVTGGTLQMGNAASGAAKAFSIAGVVPNLVLDNTSAGHSTTFLAPAVFNNVTKNITINPGTTLNIGNNVFLMNGTTLTNNGTLTANGASSNFVWFLTTSPVTYTGLGVSTAPITNFAIQADSGLTIDPASPTIVVGAIRLFSGSLINSNKITLGNGGATTGIVQIGNTTTPTAAGVFDVPFTFNLGTGGETVSYLRTTASRNTGPEINPTRTVTTFTYDDNDVTHSLTLTGGNLTVTGTTGLTNGHVITGANTQIVGSAGTVTRTTGLVDGNFRKTYAAAGSKLFEVGTANGFSPVTVNVTAGAFPSDFTVKAVQGPQPNVVTPAGALQRYWTLTGAGVTADLTFNYLDPTDIPSPPSSENTFVIFKYNGTWTMPGGSVNTGANTATITGVSSFSDWTLAQPNAPTAAPATISGRVTTPDGSPLGGATIFLSGNASARTITNSDGRYRFDNVPTEAFYTVTPALVNYSFSPSSRSFSLMGNQTDVGFTANATAPTGNPLNVVDFFVRQQYLDFLGREPDMGGWLYWTSEINACGNNQLCVNQRRIDVSAAFFASEEFQQTGSFIYRLYQTGLGRQLSYSEFTADRPQVLAGPDLEENRAAFALEFVTRPEFTVKYQNATSADAFVDSLLATVLQTSGLDLSAQREALLAEYSQGADMNHSRSRVLRTLADNSAITDAAYNPSFVLMEYFGYLRRDIDQGGYEYWLDVLNHGAAGNYRGMVCAFLTSTEYQLRFSPIVTHSNAECGP